MYFAGMVAIALVLLIYFSLPKITYVVNQPNLTIEENGGLAVNIQDQTTTIVDLYISKNISNVDLLDNYEIGERYINISSDVAPVVTDFVCLKENTSFFQGEILSVTPLGGNNYQVFLDQPLDFPYTTQGGCSIRDINWAVDGSVTPQIFKLSPFGLDEDLEWDITRVIMGCLGDGVSGPDPVPDLSSFFTTDPITNGLIIREVNGRTKNIFNIKDNFHAALEMYDVSLYPANRFGLYATTMRRTFNGLDKNGVVIRLSAATGDSFELIVQDDLTDMEQCHAVIQGHVVTD